jgi:hypothetical protein
MDACVCVHSLLVFRQRPCYGLITRSKSPTVWLKKKDYETEEEAKAQQMAVEPLINE